MGLVLGGGGVLGAAWMTGALAVLQARTATPLGDLDLLVGTSAGSVLMAALRGGVGVEELVALQRGKSLGMLGLACGPDLGCSRLPPLPGLRIGSPRLMLRWLRAPWQLDPGLAAAACLPLGRAEHDLLRSLGAGLAARWPADKVAWITAVDYDSGQRVAFGRADAPRATLAEAMMASCSVPGWFRPVIIGGRRYVDGGVLSGTNADLLANAGLARAYVLAPAASLVCDSPRRPLERLERFIRRRETRLLRREVQLLRAGGTQVTVLTPGPEDLAVMGGNLMDGRHQQAVFETSLRTCAAALSTTDM